MVRGARPDSLPLEHQRLLDLRWSLLLPVALTVALAAALALAMMAVALVASVPLWCSSWLAKPLPVSCYLATLRK